MLSDSKKRSSYDTFGHAGVNTNGEGFDGFENFGGFGDIFDAFFGGSTRRSATSARRGADLQVDISIDFVKRCSGPTRRSSSAQRDLLPLPGRALGARNVPGHLRSVPGDRAVRRSQQGIFGQFTAGLDVHNVSRRGSCHHVALLELPRRGNGDAQTASWSLPFPRGSRRVPRFDCRARANGHVRRIGRRPVRDRSGYATTSSSGAGDTTSSTSRTSTSLRQHWDFRSTCRPYKETRRS